MAFTTLGVIILWFGWFGFNPGSTLSVDFGGVGFFAYVALNTNLAAPPGVLGAVLTSWIVIKKPDLSMMLNGAVAPRRDHRRVRVRRSVGGDRDRTRVRRDRRARRPPRRARPHRRPDRRDRRARHGGRVGHARARLPRAPLTGEEPRNGSGGLFYGGGFHQLGVQLSGSRRSAPSRSRCRSASSGS
jgi:hypothetical protein